jgi:hypothetical protein
MLILNSWITRRAKLGSRPSSRNTTVSVFSRCCRVASRFSEARRVDAHSSSDRSRFSEADIQRDPHIVRRICAWYSVHTQRANMGTKWFTGGIVAAPRGRLQFDFIHNGEFRAKLELPFPLECVRERGGVRWCAESGWAQARKWRYEFEPRRMLAVGVSESLYLQVRL